MPTPTTVGVNPVNVLQGVGHLAKALAEVILDKNFAGAWGDVLTALGLFGLGLATQNAVVKAQAAKIEKSVDAA